MKIVAILLALVCLGLGYGLYRRNTGAAEEADAATKQFQSLSNQVAEVRTRLALAQGTSVDARPGTKSPPPSVCVRSNSSIPPPASRSAFTGPSPHSSNRGRDVVRFYVA